MRKKIEVFESKDPLSDSSITSCSDMQKRATQGHRNFFKIAEIFSTNPPNWFVFNKNKTSVMLNMRKKVYFVNLRGKS